jgi:hypothetical protein
MGGRVTQISEGEFVGTKAMLEHRRACAHATITKMPRYSALHAYDELFVDASGTVYARSPESKRFTLVVAQCVPKEE